MGGRMRLGVLLLLLGVAACAGAEIPAPAAPSQPAEQPRPRWRAVLVAGDPSLPVWDNATARMEAGLLANGQGQKGKIARISQRRDAVAKGALPGGRELTLRALVSLQPREGEGCFVFITTHGAKDYGLIFVPGPEVLSPMLLDRAVTAGCGEAPTMVIASGCYTGGFAKAPLARDNRVIMSAAREDRPSFGCGAGFELTFFDDCLLHGMAGGGKVDAVWNDVLACVSREERKRGLPASEPQISVGEGMKKLNLAPSPAFIAKLV